MGREIKFQLVWQGCIYESLTLQELIEGDWEIYGKRFLKSGEYQEIGEEVSIPAKDYRYFSEAENDYGVWREYTGLKDKNGVEIYEGDIVVNSCDSEHWTNKVTDKKSVIIWKEGKFHLGEGGWIINWHITSKVDILEIIGNIYENPDLLTNS